MLTKETTDVFEQPISNAFNQTDNDATLLNEVDPNEDDDDDIEEEDATSDGLLEDEDTIDDDDVDEDDEEDFDEDEDLEESDEPGGLTDDSLEGAAVILRQRTNQTLI